jgi:hypothetical protein
LGTIFGRFYIFVVEFWINEIHSFENSKIKKKQ